MPERKATPQQSTHDWRIYRLKAFPVADAYRLTSLPAAFVGAVQAADANSAVRAATAQYGLVRRYQRRLIAVRAA